MKKEEMIELIKENEFSPADLIFITNTLLKVIYNFTIEISKNDKDKREAFLEDITARLYNGICETVHIKDGNHYNTSYSISIH